MNNLKSFDNFFQEDPINEGLMDYIKKLPFYDEVVELYMKLKDKVDEYISKLPQEDIDKIQSYSFANESFDNDQIFEKKRDLVNKILKIFGLSAASIGMISGIVSMVVAELSNSATPATPWFIVCFILLAVGGVSHSIGGGNEKEKKVVRKKPASSRRKDPALRRR